MRLQGKVAIVTGAASGIGRAIAHAFGREGASVVIADVNQEGGEKVAEEVKALGAKALAVKTDVSKQEQVNAMVQRAIAEFGRVDVLVNNAAFTKWFLKNFHESEPAEWQTEIDVDLWGVLYCCKAVIPHMIEQRSGKIISIASAASKATPPRQAIYGACKAAVVGFSRCLARELGRFGILVNCVSPGAVRTPANESGTLAEMADRIAGASILRRAAQPEEVAGAVLFLASDEANYITAQNLSIDGGMTSSH